MKNILALFLTLVFISSCGSHFPKDIGPNPASNGYHQIEFDVENQNGVVKKEIGIANIFLKEDSDFSKISFTIHGIYKGTLNAVSNACGINTSIGFNGQTKFYLSEFISKPAKCSIRFTAATDQLKGKEHNIVETGIVKINVLPSKMSPLSINYSRMNRDYSYLGQGSIQRQEGDLTSSETFLVNSNIKDGGVYRIIGCGNELINTFHKDKFEVSFKEIYKKTKLTQTDTCDFEIIVIPNSGAFSYIARFSVSIYGSSAVKLEPLDWTIDRNLGSIYINASGKEYVIVCSINDKYVIKGKGNVKCRARYHDTDVYWLRSITANGRKSIIAVKNGVVIWIE